MPSKTSNISLNQWAGTDPFLRTDFNTDNARIDSAIGTANNQISTLTTNLNSLKSNVDGRYTYLSQALHDTLLTMAAESWYSGAKRGLVLDGFTSKSRMGSAALGMEIDPKNRRLVMGNMAQLEEITYPVTHSASGFNEANPFTFTIEKTGCTTIDSISLKILAYANDYAISIHEYNEATKETGACVFQTVITLPSTNSQYKTVEFLLGATINQGLYLISVAPKNNADFYLVPQAISISPYICTAGTFTSIAYPVTAAESGKATALVRHGSGTVSMTLVGATGKRVAMTKVSTANAMNVDGRECLATEFSCTGLTGMGATCTVELTMTNAAGGMEVYNYSVVFI